MQSTENGVAIKTPKKQWRRRLEIALSGWIVLPLLVCCAIQQPMRIVETKTVTTPFYYSPPPPEIPGWFRHGDFSGHGRYLFSRRRLNPRAVLTCTAIVAFISWKAFANFHSKQAHHAR